MRKGEKGGGRNVKAHEYYTDSNCIFYTIGTSQYGQVLVRHVCPCSSSILIKNKIKFEL